MSESFPKFRIINKLSSFVPQTHKFLDHLPEPWRSKAIIFGYRLGIVRSFGYVKMVGYTDDTRTERTGQESITCNIIPDVGATKLRDMIAAAAAGAGSNDQFWMEFGTGTSTPAVADVDVETPLDEGTLRLSATITSPGSYEIRSEVFLNSTYGPTRTYTINNMAIFAHQTSTPIIAHALVSPGHAMVGTNTATATYGLLVR